LGAAVDRAVLLALVLLLPVGSGRARDMTSPSPQPGARVGWVDLTTLIWFHPAMRDYFPGAKAFLKGPPLGADDAAVEAWRAGLEKEYMDRQQLVRSQLGALRNKEADLKVEQVRLRQSLDVGRERNPPRTVADQSAARLSRADEAYWNKVHGTMQALRDNQAAQDALRSQPNTIGLIPENETRQLSKRILLEIATAIRDVAKANQMAVVFPSLAASLPVPEVPIDPTQVDPGVFSNPYAFALSPHGMSAEESKELKDARSQHLKAWYRERAKAVPLAAGDSLLAPVVVSGQNLTVPVLQVLLERGGVPAPEVQLVTEFIAKVTQ
jgi:hypothetical protein